MTGERLTLEEKRRLARDGFLILRDVVPLDRVNAARRTLNEAMGALRGSAMRAVAAQTLEDLEPSVNQLAAAGVQPQFVDLFNETPLISIMSDLLGHVPPAAGAQLAALYPSVDDDQVNEAGYRNADTPNYGWCGHLDGLWNGATSTPPVDRKLSDGEERAWHETPSTNGTARYYPELNTNIANFAALVGVPLSDQRQAGVGNLGLLKGAHRRIEKFFQWQREKGGPLGPEGPGWERIDDNVPNEHGLVHYPRKVRDAYRRGAAQSFDGHYWPKPTLIKVKPGDAIIVHWATPHSSTRVMGPDPRLMVYFRTRPERPEAFKRAYPDAICNNWLEWPGMREVTE
ncbi:MAG: hypothetical protein CMQ24_14270 [Gammaproteobacteria bacterium]|nr:hypothetical protein [Gammaproteobacteria bacterium]